MPYNELGHRPYETSDKKNQLSSPNKLKELRNTHKYSEAEKGKGLAPTENKKGLVGEDGWPRKREVRLAKQYGKDNPGLAGGMMNEEDIPQLVSQLASEDGQKALMRKKQKYIERIAKPDIDVYIKVIYQKKLEDIKKAEEEYQIRKDRLKQMR